MRKIKEKKLYWALSIALLICALVFFVVTVWSIHTISQDYNSGRIFAEATPEQINAVGFLSVAIFIGGLGMVLFLVCFILAVAYYTFYLTERIKKLEKSKEGD